MLGGIARLLPLGMHQVLHGMCGRQVGGRGMGRGGESSLLIPGNQIPEHREARQRWAAASSLCFQPLKWPSFKGREVKSFLLSHLETPLQVLSSEESARQDTRS